ncbi:MAG: hypothetical protein H8E57_02450 [Candidatus Cloacimonetes bacterium]|nr:hypothetical protein [Candidatus Cloacimonadota bacterium]
MKKAVIYLILSLLIVTSLSVVGCSKNDGGGGGGNNSGTLLDPTTSEYALWVNRLVGRDGYSISVFNYGTAVYPTDVQLSIDGNAVMMTDETYVWIGPYDLTPGTTYGFDVTIDGTSYDFNLQTCHPFYANWPNTYYPDQQTTVNWTQQADPDYQDFFLEGEDAAEEWHSVYQVLSNNARSFAIPANWVGVELVDYNMSLWTVNYLVTNNLIALNPEFDGMGYARSMQTGKPEIDTRNRIHQIIERIKH